MPLWPGGGMKPGGGAPGKPAGGGAPNGGMKPGGGSMPGPPGGPPFGLLKTGAVVKTGGPPKRWCLTSGTSGSNCW